MKKLHKILIFLFVFLILILPIFSVMAQTLPKPLVPCGTVANNKDCNFNDIFTLINNIVNFLLFTMAVPISAIMFAYAGFLLLVPGGESASKKQKGKEIFLNVAIGLVLVAGAWLIIHTILTIVGYTGAWYGFDKGI